MADKKETYRCNVCGNTVEAEENEDLTCCGEPMVKVEEDKPKRGGCCKK